jgi:hypothetical protein
MSPLFSYGRSERHYGRSPTEPATLPVGLSNSLSVNAVEAFVQRMGETNQHLSMKATVVSH